MKFQSFFLLLLMINLAPSMYAQNRCRKIGPVSLIQHQDGSQSILSVIESRSNDSTTYHLQLINPNTTKVEKAKPIYPSSKRLENGQIFGKLGNVFWLLTNSLMGYDVASLELVATESRIGSINPFMMHNFSKQPNDYQLDISAHVMFIYTKNAEQYRFYPDLSMKPDTGISDKSPEDFEYEFATNYKLFGQYNLKSAMTCFDKLSDKLFILGSEKEIQQTISYYGNSVAVDRPEKRTITIIPLDKNGEKIDLLRSQLTTTNQEFTGGGFLRSKFMWSPWRGLNGEHLIIHHNGKSQKSTLCISLIDMNGIELWSVDLGIRHDSFNDFILTDDYLVIWMDLSEKKKLYQKVFYINMINGNVQTG